jgi:hypothetical protein
MPITIPMIRYVHMVYTTIHSTIIAITNHTAAQKPPELGSLSFVVGFANGPLT